MVYVIQVCRQLSSRIRIELQFHPDPAARKLSVWHVPLLSVQWTTPDDGQRNCPNHVEFHFQNKIWEISASSWFYYKEICHNTRVTWTQFVTTHGSHERKLSQHTGHMNTIVSQHTGHMNAICHNTRVTWTQFVTTHGSHERKKKFTCVISS
jgi:hypothetical protein